MTHRRLEKTFEVPAGGALPAAVRMAATIHLPAEPDPDGPILFLFHGATYARGYFDLKFDGFGGYSQAEHHVGEGMVVIAVDHLGEGESRFDGEGPTMAMMAQAADGAVRAALDQLRAGTLDPAVPVLPAKTTIGAGQSMGGFVLTAAQAAHETFDGLAALGTSFVQTRLALKPGRRYPPRDCTPAELAKAVMEDCDMLASFHWPETPKALVELDFDMANPPSWRSFPPPPIGGSLLTPGIIAAEAAVVRAPVLLVYGEVDVTADPLADVGMFLSATDISMKIIPSMAHMHNFAPTRKALWRLLHHFAVRVADQNG